MSADDDIKRLVEEVADGLDRRSDECRSLMAQYDDVADRARLNGKAQAYTHSATLLRQALASLTTKETDRG